MTKKMANKCLLLKTPDNRHFFTEESHFPLLIEFGKTFDAEISVVQFKETQVEVLELKDLAKQICEQKDKQNTHQYEVIEVKLAPSTKKATRDNKLKQSTEINTFIKTQLLSGISLSLSDIENKFPEVNKFSLNNHFTRVRRELAVTGNKFKKEKPGQYRLDIFG